MAHTVEAEIDVNGNITLLEQLHLLKKTRAVVTLLDETDVRQENGGNVRQVRDLLNDPEFANRKSYTAEEIDAQIEEARNSWE